MIQWLVPEASSYAAHIDYLFTTILVVVGFWFLMAQGVLFYFIFHFRRRPGVRARYVPGDTHGEKKWIEQPHYAIILCDVLLIAVTVYVWGEVKQQMPPAQETVRVIAQQWAWSFVHPGPDGKLDTADDIVTLDELHVQANTVYHFELTSKDVLHSFFVPAFRLKQDAVPGRVITGWFKPTLTGQFDIVCAEICGIGHGLMPARIVIETREQHQQWLEQHRT